MAKVEIYTWATCPFCTKSKALLDEKGVNYTEYMIQGDDNARAKMIKRTGGSKSLPQIFIDDVHIGGCDDIHAMDANGTLDDTLV
ncbi:MAG: glutaredoxin 3 [Alphaproteobacteria bacterium]|nr:MAG: glutaredoxin 3 [Alphaproteobacteria bacterium]